MAADEYKPRVLPWGRHTWYASHFVALGYPGTPTARDRAVYKQFFETLGEVLPCKRCVGHYAGNLSKLPLTDQVLENTDTLFKWTVDLHNAVNVALGKREWTTQEAHRHLVMLDDEPRPSPHPSAAPSPADNGASPKSNRDDDAKCSHTALHTALLVLLIIVIAILAVIGVRWGTALRP